MLTPSCSVPWPAVPGVQRGQVRQEDPDRRGLRVAGQGGPAQARGQLAQAARQHGSDPLVRSGLDSETTQTATQTVIGVQEGPPYCPPLSPHLT